MGKWALLILAVSFAACERRSQKPNFELVQDMMISPAVKAQDEDKTRDDGLAMRLPPEGTVPRNRPVYMYKGDPEGAGKNLKNPLGGNIGDGRKYYTIYCGICHGVTGKGDGTIAAKMPLRPPSLVSDKVKQWPDGRLFHIITEGQGVMGSYANQIVEPENRWAVVNYIRSLAKGFE